MSELFHKALQITGIGMLSIFIFMLIFLGVIIFLDRMFPHKESGSGEK